MLGAAAAARFAKSSIVAIFGTVCLLFLISPENNEFFDLSAEMGGAAASDEPPSRLEEILAILRRFPEKGRIALARLAPGADIGPTSRTTEARMLSRSRSFEPLQGDTFAPTIQGGTR
ncbi:hypothetical protein C5Y97_07145 [Blastopirellula marina]|uniref:Uncharacterized protein n=1 Tax=Blastopirellula marina TaxID=124 RepID=A0A2S8G753_9BACT|nr:hypothetical protein C5Y98_07145 [Blastopirellula marina]PTL45456.1 hypothetical protein C5Y97_07145 [Blastopirellula marina]